jgi:fructoselysine-6-P-deglycase FrlB-like protein
MLLSISDCFWYISSTTEQKGARSGATGGGDVTKAGTAPAGSVRAGGIDAELASQPDLWRRAAALVPDVQGLLPAPGERVAIAGCGTSWFIAQSYAAAREAAGLGETDAFAASEMPARRAYDRIIVLSRSGTTTEIIDLLARLDGAAPTTAITGVPDSPVAAAASHVIELDFADEASVVQTRFATTELALLRVHLGEDIERAAADADQILAQPIPPALASAVQFTFLGTGWTVGLAAEAALKLREAASFWTESYPAMEYRHGPIAVTGPGSVVWLLGPAPDGLPAQIAATGGLAWQGEHDPMAELVRVHMLAAAVARARGLDPDQPRNLTRSVILAH